MKKRKIEYKNEDIAVIWEPSLCIHDKSCWKELGSVFQPLKRPWVKMDEASTQEIINQIERCPSGALSYRKIEKTEKMEDNNTPAANIQVKVISGGPLMVTGTCEITHADGSTEIKENRATYCRCGASKNKPFCDGGHKAIDWVG